MNALTYAETLLLPMETGALDYLNAGPRERRTMVATARRTQRAYRRTIGYADSAALLTAPDAQAKLAKNMVPTFGFMESGLWFGRPVNLCPWASRGCAAACLGITSGHGKFNGTKRARAARTAFMLLYPYAAGVIYAAETVRLLALHGVIRERLNITSDVRWERVMPRTMETLGAMGVVFYDYTKAPDRGAYDLTRSAHETMTDADIVALLASGERVAVVFTGSKPDVSDMVAAGVTFHGFPMVDGIANDDRTRDARGVVVALAALGASDGAGSGFFRPMPVGASV